MRATSSTHRRVFRNLVRWYRPFAAPSWKRLTLTSVALLVVLLCQALVPMQVESLLHHGEWSASAFTVITVLVVVQLVTGHLAHLGAHIVTNDSAARLRVAAYQRLLRTRLMRQQGLVRSSVVARLTTDVDRVSEAFESSLVDGIPGVIRVVQSLVLLTLLERVAGIAMTVAAVVFLVLRSWVGRDLLRTDRARLDSSSRLGETTDETITAARLVSALRLDRWVGQRYSSRVEHLRAETHHQGVLVTRLVTGAHGAGLVGLLAVVVTGAVRGEGGLASVAAALLYVENVVRGLEALPPWIRTLQLGAVAQQRIDQILCAEAADDARGPQPSIPALPDGALVALVTDDSADIDSVVEHLAQDAVYVTGDAVLLNASIAEHLRGVADGMGDEAVRAVLDQVGLGHLAAPPVGIHKRLGPGGALLARHERDRLALAMGLAAAPEVLLVGPLLPLSDVDTAVPLLSVLRSRPGRATVVAVRSAELAEATDAVLLARADTTRLATHQELLLDDPSYAALWHGRLALGEVDLSVLGIAPDAEASLAARLVTERYAAGEVIYREGSPADRIVFPVSGRVEITTTTAEGVQRRVAVVAPGQHCGDLRLTAGEVRAESAVALDDCVVQCLSREAIAAGMAGVLDRSPDERRVLAALLRSGPATRADLLGSLPDLTDRRLDAALTLLARDGGVREDAGVVEAVLHRTTRPRATAVLERLGEF